MDKISSHKGEPVAITLAKERMPGVNLLLIRRRADPTDAIYLSAPLRDLIARGRISLKVMDFGWRLSTAGGLLTHLQDCTHVIVSRYCPRAWMKTLLNYPDRPFQICYLVDDDIPAAPVTESLPLTYRMRMGRVARREFAEFLRRADRVVVTSTYLAEKYQTDRVDLLPPANFWIAHSLDHFRDPATIVVSFHATAIHQGDLAAIAPALKQVHDTRPNVRLEIVTDGKVPRGLRRLPRCRVRTDMAWPEYREFVQRSFSHIGLAPLMDTPYNRGKSHIKLFDITALGAVGVYSNRPPYADVIEDGVNGFLADDDVDAWRATLIELVDNPERAKRMVESAQALVADIGDLARLEGYWKREFGLTT